MSGKVVKVTKYILFFFLFCALLHACGIIRFTEQPEHVHSWQPATCTAPRTCADCGETDGDPLGHTWTAATCTAPKTCSVCGRTEGGRADHTWTAATCTEPEHCSVCGKDRHWYSVSLGHDWQPATCTEPKTCARCGATEGGPEHLLWDSGWERISEPTCSSEGEASQACRKCGAVVTKVLPVSDHKAGDWEIVEEATPESDGRRVCYCVWCGKEMGSLPVKYTGGTTSTGSGGTTVYDNEDQQDTTASYVLNTSTMKFHRPSCGDVPRIAAKNYSTSSRSRDYLISIGYSPCGHCDP